MTVQTFKAGKYIPESELNQKILYIFILRLDIYKREEEVMLNNYK